MQIFFPTLNAIKISKYTLNFTESNFKKLFFYENDFLGQFETFNLSDNFKLFYYKIL